MEYLSKEPLVFEHNRVERLYAGGKLLDRWQGLYPEIDGVNSEEFIVSSIEYIGPGKPIEKGISRTKLQDGSYADLHSIINSDKEAFLGKKYSSLTDGQSGVLARVGDSLVRLVIQCHPTAEMAKKYFNLSSGKTEAWYIADTREINGEPPHLYCGFKKGVTKELWKELFNKQNTQGMLDCMHKLHTKKGDIILVEEGMPHAMGSGCLFVEIHDPCDYTIRFEKNYSTRTLSDDEMHYGLGYETMLNFLDYTTYSENEIINKCVINPFIESVQPGGVLYGAITYEYTKRFLLKKLIVHDEYQLQDYDGHYIMVILKNNIQLETADKVKFVPQGRGVFIPGRVKNLTVKGKGEILIAYPFKIG